MAGIRRSTLRATQEGLKAAVHRHKPFSRRGLQERLFTFAFSKLVYPQIWEDPAVDREALRLRSGDRLIAIASGGCNVLSYLIDDPQVVIAVDLNGAHIALNRLKLAGFEALETHEEFFRFFGRANSRANIALYDEKLRDRLDEAARAYWDGRDLSGRRRIDAFSRNFYHHGLLGRFIGAGHAMAKLYGAKLDAVLQAENLREQRAAFEAEIAPLFEKRFVRWLARRPSALYGLGIPPAQYRALAADGPDGVADVLKRRVERLACDFPIADNYFAWQAFGRRYGYAPHPATPPYLQAANFEVLRDRAARVELFHGAFTDRLNNERDSSLDAYVLLDAQDWMNDETLTTLWREIARTARPGARVIFRTAADERLLPGRVPEDILSRFTFEAERARELGARDRSSIYGAFHLYVRKDDADHNA
jgi:S-adenosylmethionine-diacylglycerol 3-amino-3-carboxypropyl transferase